MVYPLCLSTSPIFRVSVRKIPPSLITFFNAIKKGSIYNAAQTVGYLQMVYPLCLSTSPIFRVSVRKIPPSLITFPSYQKGLGTVKRILQHKRIRDPSAYDMLFPISAISLTLSTENPMSCAILSNVKPFTVKRILQHKRIRDPSAYDMLFPISAISLTLSTENPMSCAILSNVKPLSNIRQMIALSPSRRP